MVTEYEVTFDGITYVMMLTAEAAARLGAVPVSTKNENVRTKVRPDG